MLILFPLILSAQDPNQLINEVLTKFSSVKDYKADATIKSDIPLIKNLPVRATIYFKEKDKFRIVSKGIAILPKQGFTDITKLLREKESYTAILTGSEMIQNIKTEIVTILPKADTSDLVLAKIWIDSKSNIVMKSQITTRNNGQVTAEYTFGNEKEYGLPEKMLFTVDVKKFKIPKGLATDINKTTSVDENKTVSKVGTVSIQIRNYVVNKGIGDEVFKGK